jgi:hypothetical protein
LKEKNLLEKLDVIEAENKRISQLIAALAAGYLSRPVLIFSSSKRLETLTGVGPPGWLTMSKSLSCRLEPMLSISREPLAG